MRVAVIGAGSFGTVLADLAAHNNCEVRIYARRDEMVHAINAFHKNPQYHPKLQLHQSIHASSDLHSVVEGADLVILSVPSKAMDFVCVQLAPVI